jgi:putative ABC transport system permease protein
MGATTLAFYHNVGVDRDAFTRVIAGEAPDAALTPAIGQSGAVRDEVGGDPAVRAAIGYTTSLDLLLDGEVSYGVVTEDFAKTEGTLLYAGRYPRHANEAAISAVHARSLGKGIGDAVSVAAGGRSADYLVTGLVQSVNDYGRITALTDDAVRRLLPDFRPSLVYVYLKDPTAASAWIEGASAAFGDRLRGALEMGALADAQLGVYGDIFAVVAAVVVAIAAGVIAGALLLVLSTAILRRRRDLGVQKALGFTSGQLMVQIAVTYLPVGAVGAAGGALAGDFAFRPLVSALLGTMGVEAVAMTASGPWTVGLAVGLAAFTFATSLAVASRVRRVSAHKLVAE